MKNLVKKLKEGSSDHGEELTSLWLLLNFKNDFIFYVLVRSRL